MNRTYTVIWSKVRNCYVVVSEMARRYKKAPAMGMKGVVASVTAAAALSVMLGGFGVAWAEDIKKGTFDNFAEKAAAELNNTANAFLNDSEFKNSTGLEGINAHSAYALGYSGEDVALGILDSGVRTEHVEFLGKAVNVNLKLEDEATWGWAANSRGHGSHVAGIMAARRNGFTGMQGVAYKSTIESIATPVGDGNGNFEEMYIKYANDIGASIINNSWGGAYSKVPDDKFLDQIIKDVNEKDRIYVFTASNEGKTNVKGYLVEKIASNIKINNNVLTVVAYDSFNNELSYFTNIADGAEKTAITAPGGGLTDINSVNAATTDTYKLSQGTSMAAPYVSGALALVKEAFPYLSGKQVVDTVLTTANSNIQNKFEVLFENKKIDDVITCENLNIVYVGESQKSIAEIKDDFKKWLCAENNFNVFSDEGAGTSTYLDSVNKNIKNTYSEFKILNDALNVDGASKFGVIYDDYKSLKKVINSLKINDETHRKFLTAAEEIKNSYDEEGNLKNGRDTIVLTNYVKLLGEIKPIIADEIGELVIDEGKYKAVYKTFKDVYGAGLLDVGKAVQGIGAIDVERLSDGDKSNQYSNASNYLYKVNTGTKENNFNGRDFSIWSNDIGEKNVTDTHAGLLKSGNVDLVLLGENTYQGPTISEFGNMHIVRGVGGDVYAKAGNVQINGYAKNVYALPDAEVSISDTVNTNGYTGPDVDFVKAALPKQNKVDINGGLFALGYDPVVNIRTS